MALNIVVVGAGLGGLSASISCALSGHRVTVLEAARELAEIGAGLQITPNASRLFQGWGISDAISRLAAEPTELTVHRYSDGKILAADTKFSRRMRAKYGAPFIDLHRVDLQRTLVERAKELGVIVELGSSVAEVDFEAGIVTTKEGKEWAGDLVVGADGLWSICRQQFLGGSDEPLPTGDLAYRIVLTLDQIEDEELKRWVSEPKCRFWIGPGAHVVAYSLRGGSMFNIVLLVPDDLPKEVAKQKGSVDEMRALFKGWDPVLTRFLGYVEGVAKWKLMHRPELESWVSPDGKYLMLGDSCHAQLPYLAQGANSSIEDGAVLGAVLEGATKEELRESCQLFQLLRKKRGEAIVRETFEQRRDFHMHDGPEQEARDRVFESQLGKDVPEVKFPSRWTCPVVQPWLYGYDAHEEVRVAKNSLNKAKAAGIAPSTKFSVPVLSQQYRIGKDGHIL